jgi:hypothetical protein
LTFHSGREADNSPPSGAEVKEWVELYLHSPIRLHGVVLSEGEHRDNFTFSFTIPSFLSLKQKLWERTYNAYIHSII